MISSAFAIYHVVIGKYVALLRIDDDARAHALPGLTAWSQIAFGGMLISMQLSETSRQP